MLATCGLSGTCFERCPRLRSRWSSTDSIRAWACQPWTCGCSGLPPDHRLAVPRVLRPGVPAEIGTARGLHRPRRWKAPAAARGSPSRYSAMRRRVSDDGWGSRRHRDGGDARLSRDVACSDANPSPRGRRAERSFSRETSRSWSFRDSSASASIQGVVVWHSLGGPDEHEGGQCHPARQRRSLVPPPTRSTRPC